jgi:hypothetical protein
VTEKLLNLTDVRAGVEHVRGAGVPEQVAGAFQTGPEFLPLRIHRLSSSDVSVTTTK